MYLIEIKHNCQCTRLFRIVQESTITIQLNITPNFTKEVRIKIIIDISTQKYVCVVTYRHNNIN